MISFLDCYCAQVLCATRKQHPTGFSTCFQSNSIQLLEKKQPYLDTLFGRRWPVTTAWRDTSYWSTCAISPATWDVEAVSKKETKWYQTGIKVYKVYILIFQYISEYIFMYVRIYIYTQYVYLLHDNHITIQFGFYVRFGPTLRKTSVVKIYIGAIPQHFPLQESWCSFGREIIDSHGEKNNAAAQLMWTWKMGHRSLFQS